MGDHNEQYDSHVTFKRPNLLRWDRNGVTVVSNGEKIYGKPQGWDGQVVVAAAPAEIEAPEFYEIATLARLLQPAIHGHPVQLDLLTADEPLGDLRDYEPVLLERQQWHGRACDRVGFRTEAGELLLWIDAESYVLRRVDYPTEEFQKSMAAQGVAGVTLRADFVGATINPSLEATAFEWQPADDQVLVRTLIDPPDPRLAPNPTLGREIEDFALMKPDGTQFSSAAYDGKITVIDFWATWCGPCRAAMPKFDEAAEKYAGNDQVQFVAISLDRPEVSDREIEAVLDQVGSDVPWSRADGDDPVSEILGRFNVEAIPLYVILGKEGRAQMVHIGGDITVEKISQNVEKLLGGKDAYAEAADLWAAMQKNYKQQLEFASADAESAVFEIPRANIAAAATPENFALTELWHNEEITTPGNFLAFDEGGETKLLTISEFRDVVEIAADGSIAARHEDLVPQDAAVTFLRSAVDGQGTRFFLAGGVAQSQVFVFDADWKQKLQYPEGSTAQIYDALLADLASDGELELVIGYMREAGIHGVTLGGERIWRNRTVANVGDLAVTTADASGKSRVICAHFFGNLVPINHDGADLPPIEVPGRALTHVAVAELDSDGEDEIVTIAVDAAGARSALGLTVSGEILWARALPPGEHETPIDAIAWAKLDADGPAHWLIASADGVIHFVSADGQQYDRFATGSQLAGLAAIEIDDQRAIVIASADGVRAWSVEPK